MLMALMTAACGAARRGAPPTSTCDTSGVWHLRWSVDDGEPSDLEVTFDPARLRVAWTDQSFGRDGVATAVDGSTCRAHVLERWEVLHGAEGYEDADVTLDLDFALGRDPQPLRGVLRRAVADPRSLDERAVTGVARRQVQWSP